MDPISSKVGGGGLSNLSGELSKSAPGKSVLPIDPANNTSPLNTTPGPTRHTLPGE